MKLEKLVYTKCPNCKKHGIFFLKISTRFNETFECKYCHKIFHVHSWFSLIIIMLVLISLALLCNKVLINLFDKQTTDIILYTSGCIIIYLGEYFALIGDEINDNKD